VNRVAIIDYGAGNLASVARAVQECGGDACVTQHPEDLATAERIILPGVGQFAEGMKRLRARGFEAALKEQVLARDTPLLGICLGMQMLATRGAEGGETAGLGFIDGDVVRLTPADAHTRVPHIGWNEVSYEAGEAPPLFAGLRDGCDFYFVHGWHLRCARADLVLARTPYCGGFISAVGSGSLLGVQFHPEKSQRAGLRVIRNFLSM